VGGVIVTGLKKKTNLPPKSPLDSLLLDNFLLDKLNAVDALLFKGFVIFYVKTPCQSTQFCSGVGGSITMFGKRNQRKILKNAVI